MISEDKVSPQQGSEVAPSATMAENTSAAEPISKEQGAVQAVDDTEAAENKQGELLPSPEEQIDALGIPNWRELEKKVVKRLDMTLMPCLWVLYLFNYLDRASIAYV